MNKSVLVTFAFILIFPTSLCAAQAPLGWPEVIDLLTRARTQVTTCVGVLKSSGDKTALANAQSGNCACSRRRRQARFDVQKATGSAKPPGGVLHILAVGVDKFGAAAGGLHLDYAADDAHDVATALLESQKGSPGKVSLYADVSLTYLANDKASKTAIEDALDGIEQSMARNVPGQDVAVILVSSHGEMIDGQFYLVPYGFVANGTKNAATGSAVSASEFAKKVQALAKYGKVLLLLDACYSGAVGVQGWATDPDAKVLRDAMDLENVTVLTSSKENEPSLELPEWKHGALAQAFLDALTGAADPQGVVRLSALTDAMDNDVTSLTKGQQHLGMHINFSGDLFMEIH